MFSKKGIEPIKSEVFEPKVSKEDDKVFDPFMEGGDVKNDEPEIAETEPVNSETEETETADKAVDENADTEEEQETNADKAAETKEAGKAEPDNRYKELEQLSGLWEMAKQDPVGFFTNILANTVNTGPSKEEMMAEVMKKFGDDFDYDPAEAYKNPQSDSAKYKNEIDKIEILFRMQEIEAEKERKRLVAETERVYLEGQNMFNNVINEMKKEYGVTDDEIKLIIEDIGNPNMKASFPEKLMAYNELLCKYLKMAVKANKGLSKIKKTLNVENQIDAVAKKTIPSTPTSGKSGSTPKQKEKTINDILLGD